jgi:hypothetical protein
LKTMCGAFPINGCGYIAGGRTAQPMIPQYIRTNSVSMLNKPEAIEYLG